MIDDYFAAFSGYLRTGSTDALGAFYDGSADLARLAVYRNGFFRTCREALRAGYPSVAALLGESDFAALARGYVEAHPPRRRTLVAYGAGLPRFIDEVHDRHRLDHLGALARLDRARIEIGIAADAGPVPPGMFEGDPDAVLALRGALAPSARLLELDFAVLDAWLALRRDESFDGRAVTRTSQRIVMWRDGETVAARALASAEYAFVAAVAAGRPLAEAAEAAIEADADFDLASVFASVLGARLLTFEQPPSGREAR